MAEEMKKIDNEELEKVDGGMAAAYRRLHRDVDSLIPSEVKEKLETAKGDVEVCRILAENGIDVEKIEQKIKDAGFNLNKICLQEVCDEELEKIAGGFEHNQALVRCTCGNDNRDDFSWQFIASRLSTYPRPRDIFRCKKCNTYVYVYSDIICYKDELD